MHVDPLQNLNPDQRRAVQATTGPVLVLAGAGSGKTRTLTHRLAYLVSQGLARPEELLAVTFTNRAAREMRERTAQLLGAAAAGGITLGTFHSLGARLLREQHRYHTRSAHFTILDAGDTERLIRRALEHLSLSAKEWSPRSLRQNVSGFKQRGLTPVAVAEQVASPADEVRQRVYATYEELLQNTDAFDFDDLITAPIAVLAQREKVRRSYQQRWHYLSVDEYQDTNPSQDQLIRLLLNGEHNLCVVGDDYQAIYSWRGARVDHILRFTTTFPNCTTVYLTQNYRSTPAILSAANQVISNNTQQHHKELWTERADDTPVTVTAWPSDRQEAAAVRAAIQQHIQSGGRARDCAVLYRTNAQSRVFEEEFMRAELPYTIVGGLRFYQRSEVKDAMAFLQLLVNPNARISFERLATRLMPGVGPKALARLAAAATAEQTLLATAQGEGVLTPRQHESCRRVVRALEAAAHLGTPARQLAHVLEASGYLVWLKAQPDSEDRLDNIRELLTVAEQYSDTTAFVEAVSLLGDIDEAPAEADRVLCLTFHAAKGLEFPRVFIVGCEDNLLPHRNSHDDPAALAEERRLLYVGLTRAIDSVSLHYAASRSLHGEAAPQLPSRFLQELPEEIAIVEEEPNQIASAGWLTGHHVVATPGSEPQYHSADVGDVLVHPSFGRGVVIETTGSTVTCVFEGHGVKVLDAHTVANERPAYE